jgi:hypothetical protein
VLPRRTAVVLLRWMRTPSCVFGFSMRLLHLLQLFLGMPTAAAVGGMCCCLSSRQLAVAARQSWRYIPFLRAVSVHVPAPTPQAARGGGGLFAVGPGVAKLLAVVTLCHCVRVFWDL